MENTKIVELTCGMWAGQYKPVNSFAALVVYNFAKANDKDYRIDATSRIIDGDRNFDRRDSRNTRISNAARVIIDSILGKGRTSRDDSELIVLHPGRDIQLTLNSDLRIR